MFELKDFTEILLKQFLTIQGKKKKKMSESQFIFKKHFEMVKAQRIIHKPEKKIYMLFQVTVVA
jgi:hypothetical protein